MTQFSFVAIGNESLLVQCCETALARGNALVAVVTRNADVRAWAEGRNLRVEMPGRDLADRLADLEFDWLLSIANLSIIPGEVLSLPTKGAINFHDGPLPKHAGLNAPVWALIEGETEHGITWHLIDGGVDEGDILVTQRFEITPNDTALTLNTKAYSAAIESFDRLLDQLEANRLDRRRQDLSARSYHARTDRPSGHGLIDFSRPARDLERLVRALDHGGYWNPLALPKLRAGGQIVFVGAARLADGQAPAGTILAVDGTSITIACGEAALKVSQLRTPDGDRIAPKTLGLAGHRLDVVPADDIAAITARKARIAPHVGFWRKRLLHMAPARLRTRETGAGGGTLSLPLDIDPAIALAAVAAWAARQHGGAPCDLAWRDRQLAELSHGGLITGWAPLHVPEMRTIGALRDALDTAVAELRDHGGFAIDLPLRDPALGPLEHPDIGVSDGAGAIPGCALTVELGSTPRLHVDGARLSEPMAKQLAARLQVLAASARAETDIADLPWMDPREETAVIERWNATATDYPRDQTMHGAFEMQVDRTPDATALIFETERLSYAELDRRANRAAHALIEMGVEAGTIVGLCCRRSIDMMVGALAILKAGGAYLPMDPTYPAERLAHFIDDSAAPVIVAHGDSLADLPSGAAQVLDLGADPRLPDMPDTRPTDRAAASDLAYLIYTSGSTGKPKGVMVEHRNALNFYAGMDAAITHQPGDSWLAVTSLSFDISVLELFWTTARGLTVILTSDEDRAMISNGPLPRAQGGMEFSIYYWGNDDGVGSDKYRLLLEGAKFADANGFVAVWTPERHFHAFGGPYPNPAVTGAAVAAVTDRIGVRGGSVVAPLHHPARIAEEWAVIDNLTNGRAGMAIASGWQPDDFILRPENTPPANKPAMAEAIETVRRLWRGEAVAFPKQDGSTHEVITQPRPVSRELPVWVTTAGNPETWKEAGRQGCNVLTHLLGQSIEEVGAKIALYHDALREAGHDPGAFKVTLMLHTFLAETRDRAREVAREPMKDYLRSAAGLIKQYAWAFPAFKRPEGVSTPFELDLGSLTDQELDGILDFAFERYFNESGLFGTVEDALARVADLEAIGVGEIACLIDYGIETDTVLDGLKPLARVVAQSEGEVSLDEEDFSIAAQIVRHGVTHLQCTPSMARMFALNDEARAALSGIRHLFLGGEPLPGGLVAAFNEIGVTNITNMYGPTETTIWSSTTRADPGHDVVDLGFPIANTQLYVLDDDLRPVPTGMEGELWIGGEGVTRGYWNRPELTAERFRDNPFHAGRMYRTGDLVRRREDGRIDFVGRVDHQVKLRGYRIELGEIETALEAQDGVSQAVVLAREDAPGDLRLTGYVTGSAGDETALKAALADRLPSFMVPVRIVHLEAFPLTPNKKIDRGALPPPPDGRSGGASNTQTEPHSEPAGGRLGAGSAPGSVPAAPSAVSNAPEAAPSSPAGSAEAVEAVIAAVWTEILGRSDIVSRDNFFELGGHSLLAVQAHRALRERLDVPKLSITDIFRFPVLADLASRVAETGGVREPKPGEPRTEVVQEPAPSGRSDRGGEGDNDRARARQDAMQRRRAMRDRRRA